MQTSATIEKNNPVAPHIVNNQVEKNTPSVPKPEDFDFDGAAKRCANRIIKNTVTTKERVMIRREKLVSQILADFKAHYPNLWEKKDRVPSHLYELIEAAADKVIENRLKEVNLQNAISYRRYTHYNPKGENGEFVTERIQVIGENGMSTRKQILDIDIRIRELERKLKDYPDIEHDQKRRDAIGRYEASKLLLLEHMKKTNELSEYIRDEIKKNGYEIK